MTPLEQARERLAHVEAIDPTSTRYTVEDMHRLAVAAARMAVVVLEQVAKVEAEAKPKADPPPLSPCRGT